MATKIVTLVPFRGGDERREWCWDVSRPSLEALGYPVYVGEPRGEAWSRAEACNAAAEQAKWDVALFSDCDTIPDPGSVRRAVAWVLDTRGGARPHLERWMTTFDGSTVLAQRGPGALNYARNGRPRHIGQMWRGGGLLVVHRSAFELVGGYDESFVGWGYEDSAMNLELLAKASWDRLPGQAWHHYHSGHENRARQESVKAYRALLSRNAEAIDRWLGNQRQTPNKDIF